MTKKLYLIDIEIESFQVCVLAEDRENARRIALENADDEFRKITAGWVVVGGNEVKAIEQIPKEWQEAMPYTDDDEQDECSAYIVSGETP